MKKLIWILFLILPFYNVWGQASEEPGITEFIFVDEEPQALNLEEVRDSIGYPAEAARQGIEGMVIARILVNKQGAYVRHKIISNDVDSLLVGAVEPRLPMLKFKPAMREGAPSMFWMNIPFPFRLMTDLDVKASIISSLNKRLEVDSTDYMAWFQRGLKYKELGLWPEAVRDFQGSLRHNPFVADTISTTAETDTVAVDSSMKMASAFKFYALYTMGTSLGGLDKYDSSELVLDSALNFVATLVEPDSGIMGTIPVVHMERGYSRFRKQNYDAAMEDYEKAISLEPRMKCAVYRLMANMRLEQKDNGLIVEAYDRLLSCNPDDVMLHYSRGFYKGEKGDFDGAIADLKVTAEKSPNPNMRLVSYNRIAWSYLQAKQYEDALNAVESAIGINVLNADAFFYKAEILAAQNKGEEACQAYNSSIEYGLTGELLEIAKTATEKLCQ